MSKFQFLVLASASLASCGGDSGSDDYQLAVDQAAARQSQAIALAPASPCSAVQQCGTLTFVQPQGHCSALSYRAYSLVSATADAASAAAADERAIADHAVAIAPPPPTSCTAAIAAPPDLACVADACQAVVPAN